MRTDYGEKYAKALEQYGRMSDEQCDELSNVLDRFCEEHDLEVLMGCASMELWQLWRMVKVPCVTQLHGQHVQVEQPLRALYRSMGGTDDGLKYIPALDEEPARIFMEHPSRPSGLKVVEQEEEAGKEGPSENWVRIHAKMKDRIQEAIEEAKTLPTGGEMEVVVRGDIFPAIAIGAKKVKYIRFNIDDLKKAVRSTMIVMRNDAAENGCDEKDKVVHLPIMAVGLYGDELEYDLQHVPADFEPDAIAIHVGACVEDLSIQVQPQEVK